MNKSYVSKNDAPAKVATDAAPAATTHFGFSSVPVSEKTPKVQAVFDSVASRYDLMNDAMSGGMHRLWKQQFVAGLPLREGVRVLDLAGGTGDIAERIDKRGQHFAAPPEIHLCDINHAMLVEGTKRAFDKNIHHWRWWCGNAEQLPFADRQFDLCTMAFGIRNVTERAAALKDIYRVLKPGGQFACLEFSRVEPAPLRALYDAYSFNLIPKMGKLLAGDEASYQYLVESIRQFPAQQAFAAEIEQAGFSRVRVKNLLQGVVAIHTGYRL